MTKELVGKLKQLKSNLKLEGEAKREDFYATEDSNKKAVIKKEITEIYAKIVEIRDAIRAYNEAVKNEDQLAYNHALAELYRLADKYEIKLDNKNEEKTNSKENKVASTAETKKNYGFRNALIALGLVGTAVGITSCVVNKNNSNKNTSTTSEYAVSQNAQENEVEESKDADSKLYGMTTRLTDASNEKQVMARAQEIYNKYINIDGVPDATKARLSVNNLANVIRMFNGEFALDNGSVDYNETTIDEIANIYATYCNATSFAEYKNNVKFKPSCVFFEEDSLAHVSAVKNDELLSAVYADMNANNVDKFREDSIKWGEFVRDTFVYQDFDGKTISIRSIDSEQQFPLSVAIISPYMPSICEYSINVDLASRNGTYGNTFGICIPYCYNESNELQEIPLSKLIYDINYTSMNSLAERAGISQEQISQDTDPIIIQSYNNTKDWYNSKYNLEKGNSRILK